MQRRFRFGGILSIFLAFSLLSGCSANPSTAQSAEPTIISGITAIIPAGINARTEDPTQTLPAPAASLTPADSPTPGAGATGGAPTSAPSPEAGSTPVPTLDAFCVQGEWAPADLAGSIQAINERQGSPFELEQVTGQSVYRFTHDNKMEITFDHLTIDLSGTIDGQEVSITDQMTGTATASYSVDDARSIITLTNFGGEGIQFSVVSNGQTLAAGDFPAWRAFSALMNTGREAGDSVALPRTVDKARISAHCMSQVMVIQSLDPLPGPLVTLTRVEGGN